MDATLRNMVSHLEEFFSQAEPFVQIFDAHVPSETPAKADHICFKCADSAEFESMRALFESTSGFVYQSIIAGRRIAIIKLPKAIQTVLGEIWYLELSDQKPDGSQVSGFEHIEIYPTGGRMDALAEQLEKTGMIFEKVIRPHHSTYDAVLERAFKLRLEDEPLMEKIIKTELK